jgi:hypothetical protein
MVQRDTPCTPYCHAHFVTNVIGKYEEEEDEKHGIKNTTNLRFKTFSELATVAKLA